MDLIDYIFEFPYQGAAQNDPVVGPFFDGINNGLSRDVLVYDRSQNSSIPLPNYWFMISQTQATITPTVSNNYVAEDGTTFYVAEDGSTFYVTEAGGGGGTTGLSSHPNVRIINNRTQQLLGNPSATSATLDLINLSITVSAMGVYTVPGLIQIP